jgi:hypothetical protein
LGYESKLQKKILSYFGNFWQNLTKELKLKSKFPYDPFVAVIKQKYRGTLITKYKFERPLKQNDFQPL